MKSKEEIRKWLKERYKEKFPKHPWFYSIHESTGINFDYVFELMQEYADQQTAALKERATKLEELLEELIDAIPGQNNDQDWWPDELTNSVAAARKLLNKQP